MVETPGRSGPDEADIGTLEERLRAAEAHIEVLAEAVRAIARGLEPHPVQEPSPDVAARAAGRAHELLLAGGL